jgi:spermidine synthase
MSDRWIEETFHADWRVSLRAEKVLHEVKTDHQHLVIFENPTWGTVLMLDGVTQLSTSDENVYHEMMAHVPLMAHEMPQKVLVVGGGDGGVMREVLKHECVERVVLVEIDREVIDTALKYYPQIPATAFDDPRSEIVIADGLKYVAETTEKFDCIIVDSSEPIGPSAVLHTKEFFADCRRALAKGGVLVTQNGLAQLFPDHLAGTTRVFASLFKKVAPYICHQPCYFGGLFALNLATDDKTILKVDSKTLAKRARKRLQSDLKYWTPAVHMGAFALPADLERVADEAIDAGRSGDDRGYTATPVEPEVELAKKPAAKKPAAKKAAKKPTAKK